MFSAKLRVMSLHATMDASAEVDVRLVERALLELERERDVEVIIPSVSDSIPAFDEEFLAKCHFAVIVVHPDVQVTSSAIVRELKAIFDNDILACVKLKSTGSNAFIFVFYWSLKVSV